MDTVWRVCWSFLRDAFDVEDLVQETFLRAVARQRPFQSEEHEKAWLIVTASDLCKDALRRRARHRDEPLEDHPDLAAGPPEGSELLEAVLSLPENQKTAVYLYYYEGYRTREIARLLRCPHATVRTRLARARERLRGLLGGDLDGA